jgi:outer membrane protein OmpA-like peptidoglycan-associated protein
MNTLGNTFLVIIKIKVNLYFNNILRELSLRKIIFLTKKSPLLIFTFVLANISFSQNEKKSFIKEFYFESNSFQLDNNNLNDLNKHLVLIDKYNLINIEIFGFTDSDGTNDYNQKLSQKRVNTIKALIDNNNLQIEITSKANGEKNPSYDNNSLEKRKNRRVEVITYYSTIKIKDSAIVNIDSIIEVPIYRDTFSKGEIINLPSVNFEDGTDVFLLGSKEILDEMVVLLRTYSLLNVEVAGHVCCVNNMLLSEQRATRVYDFLVRSGINKARLTHKGYSNSDPKYSDIKDARNRRVELIVR